MKESVKVIFNRFEKNLAIFLTKDNRKIILPRDFLKDNTKEGDIFYLRLDKKPENIKDQKHIVKALLEEILNGEEEKY